MYKRTKKIKQKISEALKGRFLSGETKNKISETLKGRNLSEKHKEKIGEALEGHIGWWKGKKRSKEVKKKISESLKGKRKGIPTWNKGLKIGPLSEEHKGKIGRANKNPSKETRRKMSEATKNRPAEIIRKMFRRRIPTSLEKKFQKIVSKYNLPYKYVGDASFILERCNPDFINTNNEKIAIEVYARYYKLRNNKTIGEWKDKRREIFNKYGWRILFFNEVEVNEENVLEKLNK